MLRRSEPNVSGVRTVVAESGPDGGDEALVFVHGNPGSSRDWEQLMARAGAFCRCIAPDMPGFGHSDKPDGFNYTVAGYARHLGALLTQLKIRRAHLVLHDFGGPWGLAWAASNPSLLASLTLINIGVLRDYRWHLFARLWRTPLVGEALMATTTRQGFQLLKWDGFCGQVDVRMLGARRPGDLESIPIAAHPIPNDLLVALGC